MPYTRQMSKHLPRWIKASLLKHFQEKVQKLGGVHLKIETVPYIDENGKVVTSLPQWSEFRLDGPFTKEPSRNYCNHRVEISLLVCTKVQGKDLHAHEKNVGVVYSAFVNEIPVYRLGTGEDDNQALLGCFIIQMEEREAVIVSNFGQIEYDIKLTQSTVEGHYKMDLKFTE